MPDKTYKQTTQPEKEQRKSIRAAFCAETRQMWKDAWDEENENGETMMYYLVLSAMAMLTRTRYGEITPQMAGALKLIRIAVEYRMFEKKRAERGETIYTLQELYDEVIDPILGM